jgi:N-6 DNA Methylase
LDREICIDWSAIREQGAMNKKKEFGDFQTPLRLARRVVELIGHTGKRFGTILEPTCGVGAFLEAAVECFGRETVYRGFEINAAYVSQARAMLQHLAPIDATVEQRDFFTIDWKSLLSEQHGSVLLIGNPPWITNAGLGVINGRNLPEKSNFQRHRGLDAITGKANFDISEWMLVTLAEALRSRGGTLAMLVKSAVARKLLTHCWNADISIRESVIYQIDAMEYFDAAVDASLVLIEFGEPAKPKRASVYGQLSQTVRPAATIALEDGRLVADLDAYRESRHLAGGSSLRWRSGIKHDCSKVMELEITDRGLTNGLGELLDLEPNYLFPMFKTSEVAGGRMDPCRRRMIVTQRSIGEQTSAIADNAPRTWQYLRRHQALMGKRGSSIYRGKPEFSIFGVGDYTFAPWKVAISGMYKSLRFVMVGPIESRPVVFDDTTNFIPCPSQEAASLVLSLLESDEARTFFKSYIFWDAKRPVTIDLLGRLNLFTLAVLRGVAVEFRSFFGIESPVPAKKRRQRAGASDHQSHRPIDTAAM